MAWPRRPRCATAFLGLVTLLVLATTSHAATAPRNALQWELPEAHVDVDLTGTAARKLLDKAILGRIFGTNKDRSPKHHPRMGAEGDAAHGHHGDHHVLNRLLELEERAEAQAQAIEELKAMLNEELKREVPAAVPATAATPEPAVVTTPEPEPVATRPDPEPAAAETPAVTPAATPVVASGDWQAGLPATANPANLKDDRVSTAVPPANGWGHIGVPREPADCASDPQCQTNAQAPREGLGYDDNFVSIGLVEPCKGDFTAPGVLPDCLKKRTYKNELILIVSNAKMEDRPNSEKWVNAELVINRVMNFRDMGWEHYLVLMMDEAGCDALLTWLPDAGCVWSGQVTSEEFKQARITGDLGGQLLGVGYLWAYRWYLMSRAVQFGYNVMMVDLDVEVLQNVYHYFKHPDMMKQHFYSMMEGWPDPDYPVINGGCHYVHNAYRDGPLAWMGSGVLERTVRWYEVKGYWNPTVPEAIANEKHIRPGTFEQSMMHDIICSMIGGKEGFSRSFDTGENPRNEDMKRWHRQTCLNSNDGPAAGWDPVTPPAGEKWDFTFRHHKGQMGQRFKDEVGQIPEGQLNLRYRRLVIPDNTDGYPEELGAPRGPYPGPRGPAAQLVVAGMRMDGTDVLMADDPDPKGLRASRTGERWVMGGPSFFSTYGSVGMKGWWNTNSPAHPPPPFAHNYAFGWASSDVKPWIFKIGGWWHWQVTDIIFGPGVQPFRCSKPDDPLPKLIAFAPGLKINGRHQHELRDLHLSLIAAAMITDRVPVWPEIDCASPWVKQNPHEAWTGIQQEHIYAVGEKSDAPNMHCYYMRMLDPNNNKQSLSQPDFKHYLDLVEKTTGSVLTPSASNTVWFDKIPQGNPKVSIIREGPHVAEAELKPLLQASNTDRVLWLGQAFIIDVEALSPEIRAKHDTFIKLGDMAWHFSYELGNPRPVDRRAMREIVDVWYPEQRG